MKVYLICPVRNRSPEDVAFADSYVASLESLGSVVHYPPRDVRQDDECGLAICEAHRMAMIDADEVHVIWNPQSYGSHFDFGMAFALAKPIRCVRAEETQGKSYANVLVRLSSKPPE